MKWLLWRLGKKCKWVRKLYHRCTDGGWLWGLIQLMRDNEGKIKEQWWCDPSANEAELQKKFMEFIDAMFKLK